MATDPEPTNPDQLDPKRVLVLSGSFVFGALGFTSFFAIPYLAGSVITAYVPSPIASLVLFAVLVVLVVAFLHLSGVGAEGFLVLASVGGFFAFLFEMGHFGPSPVLPNLLLGHFVVLVVGTAAHVGLSRSTCVDSLLNRSS